MTVSLDGDDHRVHGTRIRCGARLEGRLVAVPCPILHDACYRFEGSQASSGRRSRTLRHPSLSDTCNYMKISSSFLDPSFILSGHTGEVVIAGDQWFRPSCHYRRRSTLTRARVRVTPFPSGEWLR